MRWDRTIERAAKKSPMCATICLPKTNAKSGDSLDFPECVLYRAHLLRESPAIRLLCHCDRLRRVAIRNNTEFQLVPKILAFRDSLSDCLVRPINTFSAVRYCEPVLVQSLPGTCVHFMELNEIESDVKLLRELCAAENIFLKKGRADLVLQKLLHVGTSMSTHKRAAVYGNRICLWLLYSLIHSIAHCQIAHFHLCQINTDWFWPVLISFVHLLSVHIYLIGRAIVHLYWLSFNPVLVIYSTVAFF